MLLCEPARASIKFSRLPYCADLPTSILNCCLIFAEGQTDKAVRVCQLELERPDDPPLNAPTVPCARLLHRFRSHWYSWATSSTP